MTVAKLHKILAKLIEQGHGRTTVCVDKPSFSHNLEGDGCVILDACHVTCKPWNIIDPDGGTKVRKDGSECYRTYAVLHGAAFEPTGKEIKP